MFTTAAVSHFLSVNSWNAKFCSTADGAGGQQASLSSWLPCNITFWRGEPHISVRSLIPVNKEDNGVSQKQADGGFSTCYWRKRRETEDEGTWRPIRENRVQVCQFKGALQLLWNSACSWIICPTCKCWTDYSVSCTCDSLSPEVMFGQACNFRGELYLSRLTLLVSWVELQVNVNVLF